MKRISKKSNIPSILTVCLALSGCAPASSLPNVSTQMVGQEAAKQTAMAIKYSMDQLQNLQNVAYPIMSNNDVLCGKEVKPYYGFNFTSLAEVERNTRPAFSSLYGVAEQPTVFMTVKGTPAFGKLRPGDEILAVNGKTVKKGGAGTRFIASETRAGDSLNLVVQRGKKQLDVSLRPDRVCRYDVNLSDAREVNAYADGNQIVINSGLMDFVDNNNQLALIVGHELAHNSRRHIDSRRGNQLIGALIGVAITVGTGVDVTNAFADVGSSAYAQSFEAEADYVGLYHTARAGYNIQEAPKFFRKMSAINPQSIHAAGDHPSNAQRFVMLDQTVVEIMKKKKAKQPLIPNEKNANNH